MDQTKDLDEDYKSLEYEGYEGKEITLLSVISLSSLTLKALWGFFWLFSRAMNEYYSGVAGFLP